MSTHVTAQSENKTENRASNASRRSAVRRARHWVLSAFACAVLSAAPVAAKTRPKKTARITTAAPSLGPTFQVEKGISFNQVMLRHNNTVTKIYVLRPQSKSNAKLPLVLVAPAGTRLFHGMDLGGGDLAEQLPYVRAGFLVVSYTISGILPPNPNIEQQMEAARDFQAARAGLVDERAALDYALANVPGIDVRRIFTAGHSSAATLSLLVAENDRRIRGCVAYAPVADVPGRVGIDFIRSFDVQLPGFENFMRTTASPLANASRLRCPVFLFHADDDSNVPTSEVALFAMQLRKTNRNVSFVRVPRGEHYTSMIQQGIPLAIRWMQNIR